jgi:hypothetical protein
MCIPEAKLYASEDKILKKDCIPKSEVSFINEISVVGLLKY